MTIHQAAKEGLYRNARDIACKYPYQLFKKDRRGLLPREKAVENAHYALAAMLRRKEEENLLAETLLGGT